MSPLDKLRNQFPELRGLSDDKAFDLVHGAFYSDMDKGELARRIGFTMAPPPPPPPPESPGLMRGAADLALGTAAAVGDGVKMISDAFGAENAVSEGVGKASDWLRSMESAYSQWERQESARLMEEAKGQGVMAELGAAGKAFAQRPVGFLLEGVGTSLPTIAAAFLPGGQTAAVVRIGAMLGLGAAQGAGAVKSQIHQEVERAWIASGADQETARAKADAAQEYFGSNQGQVALGTALGAAAGVLGAEAGIIGKRILAKAGSEAAGATKAPQSLMGKAMDFAKAGAKEGAPELLQGGQEAYAGGSALRNEGFDVDPWDGVAGNAALEGLAGFGMGAAFNAMPEAKPQVDPVAEAQKRLAGAQSGDEALAAFQEGAAKLFDGERGLANIEALRAADEQALKLAGRLDNTPTPIVQQPSMSELGGSAELVDAPFADRVLTLRQQLANEVDRDLVRERVGASALSEALYYLGIADDPNNGLPSQTREKALAMAEAIVDAGRVRGVQRSEAADPLAPRAGQPERIEGASPLRIGMDAGPARIGLDTSPTDTIVVDGQGNASQRTRAEEISLMDRARARSALGEQQLGRRAPPAAPRSLLQIAQDRTETGRMVATADGQVRPELRSEQVARDNETAAQARARQLAADMGLTPDVIRAQQQRRGEEPDAGRDEAQPGGVGGNGRPGPGAPGGAGGLVSDGQPAAAGVADRAGRGDGAGQGSTGAAAALSDGPSDGEWARFKPETGTKGVPRAEMPQIKAEHRGAMTQFLAARGITHEAAEVSADTLKPTQAEFSLTKVEKAKVFEGGDRSILVSSDGHVLDGHHQWIAARELGKPVKVIRLNAPIDKLLAEVKEFPSATVDASSGARGELAAALPESKLTEFVPGGLFVQAGNRRFQVDSLRDAQVKWAEFRDATGEGVSKLGNGVRVVDGAGRFIARISYNGRLWADEEAELLLAEAPESAPERAQRAFPKAIPAEGKKSAPAAVFKTKSAAAIEAKRTGGQVVPADGGYSVRPKPAKAGASVDPERDTLLQAVAKLGGISRESAKRFGLTPEELGYRADPRNPTSYAFRVKGGRDADAMRELLAEAGYFDGVAPDDQMATMEEAIKDEMAGLGARMTSAGVVRQAEQRAQEDAELYQAELDEDARAEREAILAENGLSDAGMAAMADDDLAELEALSGADAMRALGFTEEEIDADEQQAGDAAQGDGEQAAAPEETRPGGVPEADGSGAGQEGSGEGRPERLTDGAADDADLIGTAANLPPGVIDGLRTSLRRISDLVQMARPDGPVGRRNLLRDKARELVAAMNRLAIFREAAARKGYDAERVIDRLGPEPQLRELMPQADRLDAKLGNDERLVLLCCGETKLDRDAPARELYTGPTWQTFRTHAPAGLKNVAVVSAEYGLVHGDEVLATYEQPMTLRRQAIVRGNLERQTEQLGERLAKPVREVIVVGGFDYRNAQLDALIRLMQAGKVDPQANIIQVDGQIGEQRQKLGELLRAMPRGEKPAEPKPSAPRRKAYEVQRELQAFDAETRRLAYEAANDDAPGKWKGRAQQWVAQTETGKESFRKALKRADRERANQRRALEEELANADTTPAQSPERDAGLDALRDEADDLLDALPSEQLAGLAWRLGAPESVDEAAAYIHLSRIAARDPASLLPMLKQAAQRGAQPELLTSQTEADLAAKTEREARAEELDEREQVQREADAFQLSSPEAVETREDTTGDLFGGPSAEDLAAARKREQAGRARQGDGASGDLFGQAEPAAEPAPAAEPPPADIEPEQYAQLEGATVEQSVTIEESGQTATLRMDAAAALRQLDERRRALEGLKACIGRTA